MVTTEITTTNTILLTTNQNTKKAQTEVGDSPDVTDLLELLHQLNQNPQKKMGMGKITSQDKPIHLHHQRRQQRRRRGQLVRLPLRRHPLPGQLRLHH